MTVLIVFIAIILYEILKGDYKKIIGNHIITIITITILGISFGMIQTAILFNKEDSNRYKTPIEHWIMMGLQGNGTYSEEDLQYTMQFRSYEEKKVADREKIIERLQDYNVLTFIEHLNEKIKFTWTDGTYYSVAKIRNGVIEENIWNQMIVQDEGSIYKYIPQSMHIGMLLLIFINVCNTIKKKDYDKEKIVLILATLGILVFLLIWENRSRYLFTMVPVLMLLQLDGVERLEQMTNKMFTIMHRKKNKE